MSGTVQPLSHIVHDCHCPANVCTENTCAYGVSTICPVLCQEVVYGTKYDPSLRTSLKRPEPMADVLDNEVIKLALENITKQARLERGEPIDTRAHMTSDETDAAPSDEFLVALQAGNLTVDHVNKMADEDTNIVKEHQDLAIRHVQINVKLVDGSMGDRDIISAIKLSSFGSFDGGNLLILYDVKASGEDARRPELRKAALRRTHLDRLVKLALRSRADGSDEALAIQQSDILVFFDAGRHGNAHSLLGSLKDDNDKAFAWCQTQHMLNP